MFPVRLRSDLGCTVTDRNLDWGSILVGIFECEVLFQDLDLVDALESGLDLLAISSQQFRWRQCRKLPIVDT